MRLKFRKSEKEPARLNQLAGVELTQAELKHVWGGGCSPDIRNNGGNCPPGHTQNPNPGK